MSNSFCQFWNDKSNPLQILYPSLVWWKIYYLYFSSLNNIYFCKKKSIKMKKFGTLDCSFQNLWNCLCQFSNDKLIPLQVFYPSSVSWKITSLYLFTLTNIYFAQKKSIKVKNLETFEWWGQNVSNSFCQFWNDQSNPLQILYPSSVSWKISPMYLFSFNNIYFAQKKSGKRKNFGTFDCWGQNLSNSLR